MPYSNVTELPKNITEKYSDKAQAAFMMAFNAILKQTNDEARAFAGAHAAAQKIEGASPGFTSGKKGVNPFAKESVFREGESADAKFFFEGSFHEAPTRDEETGVHSVPVTLIREGKSKNNFYYPRPWLDGFATLMEGKKAYLNHETRSEIKDRQSRSVDDIAGWYTDVKHESGEVKGNLHLVETPRTEHVIKLAQANPELVGLSLNAKGKASRSKVDGESVMLAETCEKVYSTDIVTEAAAGGEITAFVASMTMDIEDDKPIIKPDEEVEKMTEEDRGMAEWLILETAHKSAHEARVAAYLEAEAGMRAEWIAKEREALLTELPEEMREKFAEVEPQHIRTFIEAAKALPPVKGGNPPKVEGEKPEPGAKDYIRKFFS